MTTIQNIVRDCLTKYVDQHGKLTARYPDKNIPGFVNNLAGLKLTLYGYIRKVAETEIEFEHNDDPKRKRYKFLIENIIDFEVIELKS